MKGYKFTDSIYASSIEKGEIFISTAHEMRIADRHSDGRTDPNELITKARIAGGEEVISSFHPLFRWVDVKTGEPIDMGEMVVMGEEMSVINNSFMYCVSTQFNDNLRKKMLAKFNADAVFEISDLEKFGSIISRHPSLSDRPFSHNKIRYEDFISDSVNKLTSIDYFIKGTQFNWQKEYRFVWYGEVTNDGFLIHVPDVKPLLKRII